MSSSIFQPGMCVNHPTIKAVVGFRCAECAHNAGIEVSGSVVAKPSDAKMCINHPSQPAIEARFCADCVAFRNKRKAEIQAAAEKAAKDSAVERTGNPNATGKRGRVADPLKKAAREAAKSERSESRAEKEAREAAFREAEDRAMLCKSEQVPALVLMRGADPQSILNEVAKLGRHFLRSGKIHFMPRSQRNRKDAIRAERPDLIVGDLTMDLDPAPFALWIPLDPKGGNKSDLPWVREVIETKQLIDEKYILVHEIPVEVPDRCNPSKWNEIADMTGAEVIDLRNYPDVLAEVSDSIAADLDRSMEWSDILRENAEIRNGVCFARTAKDGSKEYFDAKLADPENMKREDPPAEIKETAADFSRMPIESILNGRRFVLEIGSDLDCEV